MIPELTPMRWPAAWMDRAHVRFLDLLKGTAINCVLMPLASPMADQARNHGLTVAGVNQLPEGVALVKGQWPGVRMSRTGGAVAGPTGTAWVDTNGWKVRLEAAVRPDTRIWVEATPDSAAPLHADAYTVAFADSAAYGGRWLISLADRLAAGIESGDAESLSIWKSLTETAGLFAKYREWSSYVPAALVGVMSDFAGKNLVPNQELLNLLGRVGQQYRIVLKRRDLTLSGLRAVIYGDAEAPSGEIRDRALEFVRAGGLLITGSAWGEAGEPVADENPRYSSRKLGSGRIAIWKSRPDPYLLANDTGVLVSHRYDLVRLWNAGAAGCYLTLSPDGTKTLAHLLFYANEGPDSASVRIAGNFKSARMAKVGSTGLQNVAAQVQPGSIEVHLPPVPQYIALELEAGS